MTLLDGVLLLEHLVTIRHTSIIQDAYNNLQTVWATLPNTLDRVSCPFVVDGTCAVYAARPMVCRLYFSSNATHCAIQADVPANERQVDTPVARTLRPIRHQMAAAAADCLKSHLPAATFGYFDFLTTVHTILNAVVAGREDALRADIGTRQSF